MCAGQVQMLLSEYISLVDLELRSSRIPVVLDVLYNDNKIVSAHMD